MTSSGEDSSSSDSEERAAYQAAVRLTRRNFVISSAVLGAAPFAFTYFARPASAAPLARVKLGSPILTESVLLDLLPIKGAGADALRMVQGEIEKATILRTIYTRGQDYDAAGNVTIPGSVWDQISKVGNTALAILEERRRELQPTFREVDTAEVQIRRAERGEEELDETRRQLMALTHAAEARNVSAVLDAQSGALLHLSYMGELLVPKFPFQVTMDEQYDSIPRLLGRATVDMTIRRDAPADGPASAPANASLLAAPLQSTIMGNVSLVVDGYSAPVTAGNFIDLCLRGFYNGLPVSFNATEDAGTNSTLQVAIGGTYREGFVDPITGNVRRLPLEVLRADPKSGNVPFYGAARNTRVFTKAPAVQTFRIPGAVAAFHPPGDGNGGSSQFFWLTDANLDAEGVFMDASAEALDGRYSVFAYVISDRAAVAGALRPGDGASYAVDKVYVNYGADNLVKTRAATFKELLLNKGPGGGDADE
ncbi:peptidyl-prolyl cis-trans isomerase-cyclophilin family [Tribonema minus]|uniref:peptidylprolyl isomerase n=1 Tax=Tribonema minus TaxID=303371 RepID=A0A836CJU1_9STRA|nr:peptidyl-prolyl cis-trans isomerase-cyclophilin family [Tribonema minus]